jgi:hypothetical protein
MADRREALKIMGAIGTTCAFTFGSDELYGQHVHPPPAKQADAVNPQYFSAAEFEVISRIADLIIPATDTPGALAAGVPSYIDLVVRNNKQHQSVFKAGLEFIGTGFVQLSEEKQIEMLTPLSEAVDAGKLDTPEAKFFRAMKSMTADGYYTSKIGLVDELGYNGNTVRSEFPVCEIPEH